MGGEGTLQYRWRLAHKEYVRKIHTFARNHAWQAEMPIQDLQQELLLVLWKCVQDYDPDKGAKFNAYFQQCAKNRIFSLARLGMAQSRNAIIISIDQDHTLNKLLTGEPLNKAESDWLQTRPVGDYMAPSAEEECMAWEGLRERLA